MIRIPESIVQTMVCREAVDFGETSKESIIAILMRDDSSRNEDRMEEKWTGRRGV